MHACVRACVLCVSVGSMGRHIFTGTRNKLHEQAFEGHQLTVHCSNLNASVQELANQSDHRDLKICCLANSVKLERHGEDQRYCRNDCV